MGQGVCGETRAPEWDTHSTCPPPRPCWGFPDPLRWALYFLPASSWLLPLCPYRTEDILTVALSPANGRSAVHPRRPGGGRWAQKETCLQVSKCQMSARCEVRARRPASWGVGSLLSGERKNSFILFLPPLRKEPPGASGGTITLKVSPGSGGSHGLLKAPGVLSRRHLGLGGMRWVFLKYLKERGT